VHDGKSEVLPFALPMQTQGIRLQANWDTLGMRATGSSDVILDNVFVNEQSIVARRPAGEWHAMWDSILPNAMPLIMCVYLGLADAARDHAIDAVRRDASLAPQLGELNNRHTLAEIAVNDMIARNDNFGFTPSLTNTAAVLTRKTLATNAILQVVDSACTIVGGSGFFRQHPMERIARDVRAAHFHPLPEHKQVEFCGRVLAGLDPVVRETGR
jgi:acyl-CoA dehydrogenase